MRLNAEWHLANPMPKNARMDERIRWHLEHAASCACRPIPPGVVQAMRERGIPMPG